MNGFVKHLEQHSLGKGSWGRGCLGSPALELQEVIPLLEHVVWADILCFPGVLFWEGKEKQFWGV